MISPEPRCGTCVNWDPETKVCLLLSEDAPLLPTKLGPDSVCIKPDGTTHWQGRAGTRHRGLTKGAEFVAWG